MKRNKRILALLMCILMCVSLLPAAAFAGDTAAEDSVDFAAEEVVEAQPVEAAGDAQDEEPAEPAAVEQEISAPAEEPAQIADETTEPVAEDEASFETFEETEDPAETVASEAALASSGTCGDNLTWTLDDAGEGTLTISGTGAMEDFSYTPPWPAVKSVVIENGVTSIGKYAFSGCSALTSVTIPDSVTSIGDYAFLECSSLTSVTIPSSVTSIGGSAFYRCKSLTSVTIGNGVTSIGNWAFAYCSSLTSVTIPDSVRSLGDYAFSGCSALTSVTIGNGVTSIGDYAFHACSALTSVTIPDSVTSIGDYVFESCSALTSVTIPDSVTSIGRDAFRACSALTSVTIPDSVTILGEFAFESCSSLTSVTISNSVTILGDCAFRSCSALTSVTIPDSVTSIGSSAFRACSSLTSVTIPSSVTSLGDYAFSGCSALTSVTFLGNAPGFGNIVFAGDTLTAYYPQNNRTWTSDVMQRYGGMVTWTPASIETDEYVQIVTPNNVTTFTAGNKVQLTASKSSGFANATVVWSIVDGASKQVSINAKGLLTIAKTCPAMTITVKATAKGAAGELSDTVELQIIPQVTKLNLTGAATIYVYEATSVQLGITVEPETASAAVTWKSSNEKIATVDETGLVTVNGTLGSVNITATSTDGSKKSAKYTVKVLRPVEDITLTTPNEYAVAGNSLQLKAVVTPSNAGLKTVEWSLDADESLASYLTLSTGGKLTVLKTLPTDISGTVTVTAKAIGASEPISQSVTLKVVAKATSVTLYKDGVELIKNAKETVWLDQNDSFKLTAAAAPAAACQDFIWSSSNKKVAEVDQEGNVNACAKGSTTITATTTDGKKVAAKYTLTVGIPVESVEITNASAMPYLVPGGSFTPKTSFSPTNATSKTLVWTVEPEVSGITVNAKNGKLTVAKNYSASVPVTVTLIAKATGTTEDVTASVTFTLQGAKAKSVSILNGSLDITKTKQNLAIGDTMSLTAIVNPTNALQAVTWKSSNAGVVSVDQSGNIKALKKGTVTITAIAMDGSKVAGKVTITVK